MMRQFFLLVAVLLMTACAMPMQESGDSMGDMGDSEMVMDGENTDEMTGEMTGMPMPDMVEGELTVANVRANMTLPSSTGSVWLVIMNGTDADDLLLSAEVPGCGVVEIHNMLMENDVMLMRQLEGGVPIPAGEMVELKQGGLHVMCIDKDGPLEAGTDIEIALQFEHAGMVSVSGTVVPPGGMVMDHGSSDGEGHEGHGEGHDHGDGEAKDGDGEMSHDHNSDDSSKASD